MIERYSCATLSTYSFFFSSLWFFTVLYSLISYAAIVYIVDCNMLHSAMPLNIGYYGGVEFLFLRLQKKEWYNSDRTQYYPLTELHTIVCKVHVRKP